MTTRSAPHDVRTVLARAPVVPAQIDRFTANELFGGPGSYPDGTPMAPAPGGALDDSAARAALVDAGLCEAASRFDDPELAARVPDAGPRAGLAALVGTVAGGVLRDLVAGRGNVDEV